MRALWPLLLLVGCSGSEPTIIDGSTPETFAETTARARSDLPVADRLDYDRALASAPARRFGSEDPEQLKRTTFDGMTARELVGDYRARQR